MADHGIADVRPALTKFEPRKLGPKDWGLELLVAQTEHYTGKMLAMNAGACGPFQYHREKNETFYLYSGVAKVKTIDAQGYVRVMEMQPGESYHVPPGAPHQVYAVSDCVFFEASTPHFDDRVALTVCEDGTVIEA